MNEIIKSLNTVKEVEEYRNQINEECNSRISFINLVRRADELSNSSFGYIKECFESLSPELFKTQDGKGILNKYISLVNSNKNLSKLQTICEGIRKSGKDTDVNFFINKLSEKDLNINKSTLKEDVKSLGMVLAEGYLCVGESAESMLPTDNKKLNSAINYIVENKYSLSNMSEYSNAVKIIKENIENKETVSNIFESKDLEALASELLNEFNKKYSETLTEDEAKVLKEIASSENREEIFNKYKSICLENITKAKSNFEEKGDEKSCSRLANVLEQVNNKKYSLNTIGEDICNLMELSNIFE